MVSEKIQGILDTVGALSVLELNELVKELQEQWGVTAVMAPPVPIDRGKKIDPVVIDERSEFDVVIKDAGAQKVPVIRAVRELVPRLGLKEAKDLVEAAPSKIAEGISREEATRVKEKLEAAGAVIEIR